MSKITVKHYINSGIKPLKGLYPVYIRLTYQKKHNFIKSFSDIALPKDFEIRYSTLGIEDIERILNDELSRGNETINLKLSREKIEIEKAIEVLISRSKNGIYERKGIKLYLDQMFTPLEPLFIKKAWEMTLKQIDRTIDEDYYTFYNMFDKEVSLGEVIGNLDDALYLFAKKKDIVNGYFLGSIATELFRREQLEIWEATQAVLNNVFYNSNPLVIDWFLFDMESKLIRGFSELDKKEAKKVIDIINNIINSITAR